MRPEIQVSREEFREVANWVVGAEVDRHVIEVRTGGAIFIITRSYAALRAADLDWIVGPGYSLGRVHSGEKP